MNAPFRSSAYGDSVATASADARTEFIHKTYQHLALAILAFAGLEALLLNMPGAPQLVGLMVGNRFSWFIVLAMFMGVSHFATKWASSARDPGTQYLGLGLYVLVEALVFLPLMYMASHFAGADVIPKAGILTGVIFGGLTATVLLSKKDFSFMRGILSIAGFGALGMIVISMIFGISLGSWFALAMVVFAGGAILYETSNVLHHYRPGQHVAASLALFASVALLFWYVLRLMSSSRR